MSVEENTGRLFGDLWGPYDERLFEESVALFARRLSLAGFDPGWLAGKTCLDAGCGGGRNSVAMARLGARRVVGIDVGEKGLHDARRRARELANVRFQRASLLDIPYRTGTFDLVWCAGVLMITDDAERGLDELARVTRRGGYLYLLVYATGGLRWPLVQWLRPQAAEIGQRELERAIETAGLPANKRRTFLDDLFCPRLDFYDWGRLAHMLERRGFGRLTRWGPECRLDHEASLESYRDDLEALLAVFAAGSLVTDAGPRELFRTCRDGVQATIDTIRVFEAWVKGGTVSAEAAMATVIGQGHHRVLAVKG
jgi:SAM-dependent methyltransferase